MMEDGVRDAAEYHTAQPMTTAGSHHQKIGTDGLGFLENRVDWNAQR